MKKILILLAIVQSAYSAVVSNTHVALTAGDGALPYHYVLTVEQYSILGGSHTSIFFDGSGENLIYRTRNLDEGSLWYFTMLNDEFSADTLDQFTLFNQPDQSFSVPYGNFYFGVQSTSPYGDNVKGFGWALLNHSASGLTLLGSAMTYDEPGMIVGTTTTIPEVGTMFLLLPALTVTALMRRRRHC